MVEARILAAKEEDGIANNIESAAKLWIMGMFLLLADESPMQFLRNLSIFCLLVLVVPSLWAVELGKVTVPLDNRSTSEITRAEKTALSQLITQLTGQEDMATLPGAEALIADAHRQLSQYTFGTDANGRQTLEADFDVRRITEQLMQAGAPIWSLSRPDVLLWLVDSTSQIVVDDSELISEAALRGLPLLLPNQLNGVTSSDIRGRFIEPVYDASRQQSAELFVTAIVYGGANTTLRWWLYQGQEVLTQQEISAESTKAAKQQLVDQLTVYLAKRYAVRAGEEGVFALSVDGVKHLANWHAIQQYLQGLTGMEQVITTGVKGEMTHWQLAFSGSKDQLERLLSVNRHLQQCQPAPMTAQPEAGGEAMPNNQLNYCWR